MERALAVVVVAAIIVGLVCYVVGNMNGHSSGYELGLKIGEDIGYESGKRAGENIGYDKGYSDAVRKSQNFFDEHNWRLSDCSYLGKAQYVVWNSHDYAECTAQISDIEYRQWMER